MNTCGRIFFSFWILFFGVCTVFAANPFEDAVRKTEPLTPEQERDAFHLPPGFEVQLVASEPEIGKPMNMAFDAKGRLWLTQSREYPFPVLPVEKKGRDKIMVLEDFDSNGRARKVTTFADGLNIPIGLYPYKDGVIAFSIPKIHFFRDTDGDGKADKDEILLTGFDYKRDTHGLTSNFRRGFDGRIYADHGFANDSTIVGRDNSSIKINSGNTYRFQPDGTQVEQFTFGQVNPFGLMFDPLGDLWSTDCHSSPTYVLLHGAYYPSFGKPHDGLGFAPDICKHSHGSTAICGMVFYDDDRFPAEFRWNTYIGNVMTCRIDRDSYIEHGSTRIAKEEPDFLVSDDPWFRPVMLELGPDGAIYVADFYNRIIGHYEVPLDHPGRDRERGRIWRIAYKGGAAAQSVSKHDLSQANASKLIAELGAQNITRRMLATDQLVDRVGKSAIKPLTKIVTDKKTKPSQRAHSLWALNRLGGLDEKLLARAANDLDRLVRIHSMRVLADVSRWTPALAELARRGLNDSDPFVKRAAADALAQHPMADNVAPLVRLKQNTPADDAELVYVTRMALRNQLASNGIFKGIVTHLNETEQRAVADVAAAIKSEAAAAFLLDHLTASDSRDTLQMSLRHIARYAPENQLNRLRDFARAQFSTDLEFQHGLFKSVQEGTRQRGEPLTPGLQDWGSELAEQFLASVSEGSLAWHSLPIKGKDSADPWFLQNRSSADGVKEAQFLCSLPPNGENLTGILRSRAFTIPSELKFFIAGHDGFPDKPMKGVNYVQLREAGTEKILAKAAAPRNDTAQSVTWDLKEYAGKKGCIELVDGDDGAAYAWLAAGRFNPETISLGGIMPSEVERRRQSAAELAADLDIQKLEQPLDRIFLDENAGTTARASAAKALVKINPAAHESEFAALLNNASEPQKLRLDCARALIESGTPAASKVVVDALAGAPQGLQTQIALALAAKKEGAETLLEAVEHGKASRRLLLNKTVKDRLAAAKPLNLSRRMENLTRGLPAEDAERQKLIDRRLAGFNPSHYSANLGAQVFKQSCSVCHSLDGQGATIGPQLDGAGNRGAERLIEDILDPSRNVDPAFRATLLTLKDGDVQSGLIRREEGETVVVADTTGKERSIPKSDISERRESALSLMPDNFSETIKLEDFNHLLGFLLSKSTKPN